MSHANGEVLAIDPKSQKLCVVGHYEYNGTCDIACNRIVATREERDANWRSMRNSDAACTCGRDPVEVTLYSDYGYGFHWESHACLGCGVITGLRDPYDGFRTGPARGHPLRPGRASPPEDTP